MNNKDNKHSLVLMIFFCNFRRDILTMYPATRGAVQGVAGGGEAEAVGTEGAEQFGPGHASSPSAPPRNETVMLLLFTYYYGQLFFLFTFIAINYVLKIFLTENISSRLSFYFRILAMAKQY